MRKICAFAAAAALVLGILSGCSAEPVTVPVHVEGSIFGGSGESIAADVVFNKDWFKKNNTEYNKDLAAFAALISADVYFRDKDLERGTQNRVLMDQSTPEEYDRTALLNALGFSDVKYVESYKEKEYAGDGNDSATLTLGYYGDDTKNDIFVAALRGCFSAQEWNSVFDVGCGNEAYTAYTGEHPEWLETEHQKGIDVAANRAKEFILEFIQKNDDPDKKNCILLTGHSRGGAIANILGAQFEKDDTVRSFTYTFNSSAVTEASDTDSYKTVFNVFDTNDFFTDPMPFGKEQFTRYGKTMTADIGADEKIRTAISEYGRTYTCIDPSEREAFRAKFGERFPDRASLYETMTQTESFDTREEAETRLSELQSVTDPEEGLGLDNFCSFGDIEEKDGKFEVSMDYCSAAVLTGYGKILAYGEPAYAAFGLLFTEDEAACGIADLLMKNAAGITAGHQLLNSYVLTQYVK